MSDGSTIPGCFKYGCVGCLSLVAMAVGLTFLFGAIHLTQDEVEPDPQRRNAEYELPRIESIEPEAPNPPMYPGSDTVTMPEVNPLPEAPPEPPAAGKLILDISMTELTIRPGPADQPIRIEADYDQSSYELEENFSSREDGTWTYEISFGGRGGLFGSWMSGNDSHNEIELIIPRDHYLEIVGEIGIGETEADFGGLWIGNLNLELGAGDHFLEFRKPLLEPMQSFEISASFGNVEVRKLGNASPKSVEVGQSAGELLVDLNGPWSRDSRVDVKLGLGECGVWLPDDAFVEIEKSSVSLGERRIDRRDESDIPEDAPTLVVSVRGQMGEVRIE